MDQPSPIRILFFQGQFTDYQLAQSALNERKVDFISCLVSSQSLFDETLNEFQPDVLILDGVCPEVNVIQILELARQKDPAVSIIVVGDSSNEELIVKSIQAGAADFLYHHHLSKLPDAIRKIIASRLSSFKRITSGMPGGLAERKLAEEKLKAIIKPDGGMDALELAGLIASLNDENIKLARLLTEKDDLLIDLSEREKQYHHLVHYSSDPIFAFNLDETYRFVNEAFARPFGKKPEEIIGKTPHAIFPHAEAEKRLTLVRRVFITGEKGEIEVKVNTHMGDERYYLTLADPIKDDQGKVLYVTCISKDITGRKQVEDALRESEEKYKLLHESAGVGIGYYTPEGEVISYNKMAAKHMGGKPEDFTGKSIYELFPTMAADVYMERIRKAAASNEAQEYEDRVDLPVTPQWFHSTFTRITESTGKVIGIQIISTDTTKRKQAEMDLKAAYTKLEALWSITSLENADLKTTSDHILVTIARMTGSDYGFYGFINAEESVMTIHSWSGEAMKDCSMVDKPLNFSVGEAGIWAEAIRRREPLILNNYNIDHPAKKGLPAGHVPLKNLLVVPHLSHGKITSIAAVANRLNDYNQDDINQIATFLTTIEAIVDRKRSEEALRVSEEKYRLIVENQQDLVVKTDVEGHILYINPAYCDLFDKTEEELLGTSYTPLVHPDDLPIVEKAIDLLFKPPFECAYEERANTRTGWHWLSWRAKAVLDENGVVTALIGSGRDITERKQAEEELRMSEARYQLVDEASQDLIYSYDNQSRFTHANSRMCRLLGLKREQIIGKTHEELGFPQDQCSEWARLHQQVYDTHATVVSETITPIDGGNPQYFEVVLNPIYDETGAIMGIAGTTRDINARKLAEAKINQQLEELQRWHNVTLGREDRILQLKVEVNQILAETGKPPRYASVQG